MLFRSKATMESCLGLVIFRPHQHAEAGCDDHTHHRPGVRCVRFVFSLYYYYFFCITIFRLLYYLCPLKLIIYFLFVFKVTIDFPAGGYSSVDVDRYVFTCSGFS